MPFASERQRRLFYAAASGRATKGPSQAVARKFIRDSGQTPPKPERRLEDVIRTPRKYKR